MPKRLIDGEAVWTSEKLLKVAEKYRGEYTWTLPLTQANGAFECTPSLIWRNCYAMLRPGWTVADVTAMLDEYEAAKLLFRFDRDGKRYGMYIGVHKDGRLPKPSDRMRNAQQWQHGIVPADELAEYLGIPLEQVAREYRDVLASSSPTGNGVGLGSGNGIGIGNGIGRGSTTPSAPSTSPESSSTQNEGSNPFAALGPEWFADHFHYLVGLNPHCTTSRIPKSWKQAWTADFSNLLNLYSAQTVAEIIVYSQSPAAQKYYIRPAKLVEHAALLLKDIERLKKNPELWAAIWNPWVEMVNGAQEDILE